jgi:hypothetical protein
MRAGGTGQPPERRPPALGADASHHPDQRDQTEHRGQQHGGVFGDACEPEGHCAERRAPDPGLLEVPPPRADGGEKEEGHHDVGRRQRAVGEERRAEG